MCNVSGDSLGRTEEDLATGTEANNLKRERRESRRLELSNGGRAKVETVLTKEELDVFKAERRAISSAVCIFTGAEEKEKRP